MYERINGKLYKAVDEGELRASLGRVKKKIDACLNGVKTCDDGIKAFGEQKQKYLNELDALLKAEGIDMELFAELFEGKGLTAGF